MHTFLNTLNAYDRFEGVYYINFKYVDFDTQINTHQCASNGNPYIRFNINDKSGRCYINYYYKDVKEIEFLRESNNSRSKYVYIKGRAGKPGYEKYLTCDYIAPAGNGNDIVFDTSDLYDYDDNIANDLLSINGRSVFLTHTSSDVFQDNFDFLSIGDKLQYKRIYDSPHDKYQVNVYINDIDDVFNVPAYMTPTLGKLIDDGHRFEIKVLDVTSPSDTKRFAGIKVLIREIK